MSPSVHFECVVTVIMKLILLVIALLLVFVPTPADAKKALPLNKKELFEQANFLKDPGTFNCKPKNTSDEIRINKKNYATTRTIFVKDKYQFRHIVGGTTDYHHDEKVCVRFASNDNRRLFEWPLKKCTEPGNNEMMMRQATKTSKWVPGVGAHVQLKKNKKHVPGFWLIPTSAKSNSKTLKTTPNENAWHDIKVRMTAIEIEFKNDKIKKAFAAKNPTP